MHGGDIYRNKVKIDFSVNINPLPIPRRVKSAMRRAVVHCMEYPDIQAQKLKKDIEQMCGVAGEHILCGNGASELFIAIVNAVKPDKIGIPVPSFSGYEYAAKAAGSKIVYFKMKKEDGFCLNPKQLLHSESSIDMLILANPNNPVGNVTDRVCMERLIKECFHRNTVVVLDECFIEFTEKEDSCSFKDVLKEYPNLIIVRAFTKLYAIPGVRLGYLLCQNQTLLKQIKRQLPEWNLSVFAQAAGSAACRETKYRKRTVNLIRKERAYLTDSLRLEGIHVLPSETNFLLLYTKLPLYEELLKRQILIRDCRDFQGLEKDYYRIAVRRHRENRKLIAAVIKINSQYSNLQGVGSRSDSCERDG